MTKFVPAPAAPSPQEPVADEASTAHQESRFTTFDVVAPLLLLLAVIVIKQLFLVPMMQGSLVNADEELYVRFARSIFNHGAYRSPQYPPLFPALIAPAFLAGASWYGAMKIIVSVLASITVLPAYYLARLFVDRYSSLAIALLVAVTMAGQLVLSLAIMSENLYHPLFLLAILLALVRLPKRPWISDVLFGVALGALYLTRYVSLVAIPVLVFAWFLRELDDGDYPSPAILAARLLVVISTAALVYSPWLLLTHWTDATVKDALGFVIASKTNPAQLTFERLMFFVWTYLAYFVLLAAPTLHLLFHAVHQAILDRRGRYARFVLLVFTLTSAFGFAMIRHSWRAYYNYPEPVRIVGRYGIYIALMFTILAAVTFVRLARSDRRQSPYLLAGMFVAHSALLVAAYSFLMTDWLGGTGGNLLRSRSSADFLNLYEIGWPVVGVAVLFAGLTAAALAGARPARKWLVPAFLVGLIAWSAWGIPAFYDLMERHERYAFHARQVAAIAQKANVASGSVFVGSEVEESFELEGAGWTGQFRTGMREFGLKSPSIEIGDVVSPPPNAVYPLIVLRSASATQSGSEIGRYQFRGQEFVVSVESTPAEF